MAEKVVEKKGYWGKGLVDLLAPENGLELLHKELGDDMTAMILSGAVGMLDNSGKIASPVVQLAGTAVVLTAANLKLAYKNMSQNADPKFQEKQAKAKAAIEQIKTDKEKKEKTALEVAAAFVSSIEEKEKDGKKVKEAKLVKGPGTQHAKSFEFKCSMEATSKGEKLKIDGATGKPIQISGKDEYETATADSKEQVQNLLAAVSSDLLDPHPLASFLEEVLIISEGTTAVRKAANVQAKTMMKEFLKSETKVQNVLGTGNRRKRDSLVTVVTRYLENSPVLDARTFDNAEVYYSIKNHIIGIADNYDKAKTRIDEMRRRNTESFMQQSEDIAQRITLTLGTSKSRGGKLGAEALAQVIEPLRTAQNLMLAVDMTVDPERAKKISNSIKRLQAQVLNQAKMPDNIPTEDQIRDLIQTGNIHELLIDASNLIGQPNIILLPQLDDLEEMVVEMVDMISQGKTGTQEFLNLFTSFLQKLLYITFAEQHPEYLPNYAKKLAQFNHEVVELYDNRADLRNEMFAQIAQIAASMQLEP